MQKSEKIKFGVKLAAIVVVGIVIAYFSAILIVQIMDEFLRVNWQYSLFEDNESTMIFIQYMTTLIIIAEAICGAIFYRRNIHK